MHEWERPQRSPFPIFYGSQTPVQQTTTSGFPAPALSLAPAAPGGEEELCKTPNHLETVPPRAAPRGWRPLRWAPEHCSPHISAPHRIQRTRMRATHSPMALEVQGSLSHHAVLGDPRYHAVLPSLEALGGRRDPAGQQRGGSDPEQWHHAVRGCTEGGDPRNPHRGAVLAGFALLARGAGRALEAGVSSTARGASITTNTLGAIFASRARGSGGAWVTLKGRKAALVQSRGGRSSSPTSQCCLVGEHFSLGNFFSIIAMAKSHHQRPEEENPRCPRRDTAPPPTRSTGKQHPNPRWGQCQNPPRLTLGPGGPTRPAAPGNPVAPWGRNQNQ